jgi:hypothetical protein|uniref:Chromosomal replication initiator protein n=1 Tax=Siphoviridae sp. ctRNB7 TaxID=2825502 RepID=A0A8S5PWX6_9CAUD|nr:MAG TPA: chromosomal replication initiator protein [Siphoviridae sp. ctRNB7]
MLDKIKKALETVTEAHHFSQSDIKKLFCGLAHKHSRSTQEEIAHHLQVARSSVAYYLRQHTLADKNTQYHNSFKEAEAVLITLIKKDDHS